MRATPSVDEWMNSDETKIKERGEGWGSINPTPGWLGERERQKRERGEGRERKIASRLCSVKGEITHLRRFFQATTGSIDQAAGFMSQFST